MKRLSIRKAIVSIAIELHNLRRLSEARLAAERELVAEARAARSDLAEVRAEAREVAEEARRSADKSVERLYAPLIEKLLGGGEPSKVVKDLLGGGPQ